jgi:hypothetical protein
MARGLNRRASTIATPDQPIGGLLKQRSKERRGQRDCRVNTMTTDFDSEFLLGKTEVDGDQAFSDWKPRDMDPVQEAKQVIADLGAGTRSEIDAYVRIRDAVEAFTGHRQSEDRFFAALVEGHVLPKAEADLGFSSPKLSKLCTIGDCGDMLLRPDVLPFLRPGYSVLYATVLLYEDIPGDGEEAKARELVRILSECEGPLTRDYLTDARRGVIRRARTMAKTPAGVDHGDVADPSPIEKALATPAVPLVQEELADLTSIITAGNKADLLLVTPSAATWRLLSESYPDPRALERALPLHEAVAPKAAVVILAQVHNLAVAQNVLMSLCGFSGQARVLMLRRPGSPDVTQALIMVAAARDGMTLAPIVNWLEEPFDLPTIARTLVPEATNKLHAFAPAIIPDWCCLVDDATWAERPSL